MKNKVKKNPTKKNKILEFFKFLKEKFLNFIKKIGKNKFHKSFKRSYREDYTRDEEMRGLLSHAFRVFGVLKRNYKTMLAVVLFTVCANIFLTGMMSEELYRDFQKAFDETNAEVAGGRFGNFVKAGALLASTVVTGGLNQAPSEVQQVFGVLIFLIIWLVVIYVLRADFAKRKVKFREALYNALSPLVSTLIVFLVGFLQSIPIFIVMITYSAAKATDFLSTPFYALLYFLFAMGMLILSIYLLSGTFLALVAVTAPGVDPMAAITAANDLIIGRRLKFAIRFIFVFFIVGIFWILLGMPIILLDMWLKAQFVWFNGAPLVPLWILMLTSATFVYMATYFYALYRDMLSLDVTKE